MIEVYNLPHDSPYCLEVELFDAYLQDIISSAHEKVCKNLDFINLLIVGDVNLPRVDWSLLSSNNAYGKRFASFFENTDFVLS